MKQSVWCVVALMVMGVGCTPQEEKVQKLAASVVEECKKGEGPFVPIPLMVKERYAQVLREACDMPITDVVVEDAVNARAKVGPYVLIIAQDDENKVWALRSMEWEPLDRARRERAEKEPKAEALEAVERDLAEVQEALPKSAWVRLERLQNALDLWAKQRKAADEPKVSQLAEERLGDALAWAQAESRPEVAAEARLKVMRAVKKYQGQTQDEIDGLGTQDDYLTKSIEMAKKEKDKESQAGYEKELAERLERRPAIIADRTARLEKLNAQVCEQAKQFNPNDLKDEELKKSAQALQGSLKCM